MTYHHLLDPATGYPAESGLVSVTVWSQSGTLSDALSTACFVLGREDSLPLLEQFEAEAIFIDEGFGSLDPASIRDALDVLTRIGAGGKVGIISHVEALRENILQGIEVVKTRSGSRINLHI